MKRISFISPASWLLLLLCVSLPADAKPDPQTEQSGGWRLATQSSPYLRLHADNPVNWYPWGMGALNKARDENKPLFISIGYFTCHWCHVMARESFSNPDIAQLLNDDFISIKIDREQRPDLDDAYMEYVTLTRGHGGWPMSVWALPTGEPFVGGTYFPPDDLRGRPGMKQLLPKLAALWQNDEADVRAKAAQGITLLKKLAASTEPHTRLSNTPVIRARKAYANSFDELQGGFGAAPKFPQPARLLFLLQDDEQASVDMALLTLDKMAAGGINDQLGGGFHRYSTDFDWRVPHFEKMLYDQALIARAYLLAYRRTGEMRYADEARAILDFSLAEMRNEDGGFYAALGADSPVPGVSHGHMEEGAYYTWSWQQLDNAIDDDALREWANVRYGLNERGNAISDPLDEMAGRNVLYRALDNPAMARHFKVDLITASKRNAEVERLLMLARNKRPAVPVDDKVISAWNGYMLTTLAMASTTLDEPAYQHAAESMAAFLEDALFESQSGLLYRDWREGERGVAGFSGDYAAVAEGLVSLYKASANKHWLQLAQQLIEQQRALFEDAEHGGFYSTPADTTLWVREKQTSDGATLSVNGVALHVLLQLGKLTGRKDYQQAAWKTAAWSSAQLGDASAAMPYSLIVWKQLLALNPAVE